LWLIKVWFSASTFVVKSATFAKPETVRHMRTNQYIHSTFIYIATIFILAFSSASENPALKIDFKCTDSETGKRIYGVSIDITINDSSELRYSTDSSGRCRNINLPNGNLYTIVCSHPNYLNKKIQLNLRDYPDSLISKNIEVPIELSFTPGYIIKNCDCANELYKMTMVSGGYNSSTSDLDWKINSTYTDKLRKCRQQEEDRRKNIKLQNEQELLDKEKQKK
jgi:hypothetical protein